jgi:hypothetical protein
MDETDPPVKDIQSQIMDVVNQQQELMELLGV